MKWLLSKPPMTVQTMALEKAEGRIGYNWWMEVGLGKTWTELNAWANDYNDGRADFHVVIALNSFKQTWLDEIEFTGAPKGYTLWDRPYDVKELLSKGKIGVVMNWEALIGQGGKVLHEIAAKRKVRFALDEGHRIKTPTSQVSKFVTTYWKDVVARSSLTGTPMDNSVLDMFVPLKLGEQLNGWNMYAFRNRYAVVGGFKGKKIVGVNEEKLPELHRIRDRAGFVATKTEWLKGLPPQRWVTPIKVPMHPKLIVPYRDMQQDFFTQLDDGDEVSAELVVTQLLRLQQISSGFVTNDEKEEITIVPVDRSFKYKALLDLIEAQGGSKLLIFTHFVWTTNNLYEALRRDLDPSAVAVMRGKGKLTPTENHTEKRRFNEDDNCTVMVAQSTVASESHTLLGSDVRRCRSSLFYENTYVLRIRMQAEGRNHRKGQDQAVDYYDFVSSPVETKVINALQKKLDIVKAVMTLKGER